MLFNSIDFAVFLPIVFFLYWFVTNRNLRLQNSLIVVASFVFYGWWDYRFLALLFISSFVDYLVAIRMSKEENSRKRLAFLWISIALNLGLLGFFKYYNFFVDSFIDAFSFFGREMSARSLNIVLPVGISFYTFQTLGYTIDVYKKKTEPARDMIAFFAFVSFFPQLVAGPIERATSMLPQFFARREFQYQKAVDGLRQILWGLFKKIVIADNCAEFANAIFNNSADYSGTTLMLGAFFFAIQIYGDFSGYSDIAIGTARLFGFNMAKNFAFPYFSRDIAEFWRRWHISLSTWFRDFVYLPLGGGRGTAWTKVRNTFIVFVLSGFWHGAKWTFIAWGVINALYFLPLLLTNSNRKNLDFIGEHHTPTLKEVMSMIGTFALTTFAWIFFRAETISHAFSYIGDMFSGLLQKAAYVQTIIFFNEWVGYGFVALLILFFLIEWVGRMNEHALGRLSVRIPSRVLRIAIYYSVVVIIFWFGGKEQQFIYFQF